MKLKSVKVVSRLVLFLFAVWSMRSPADAQVLYGSIVGNVRDTSGAAIPAASVVITNKETSQIREAATNDEGSFSFPTVQGGTYDVKVTKEGFRPALESNLAVTTNSVARADITLQVGSITETLEVTGATQLLQTDRSETRSEIATKTLTDAPVPLGRNYQSLFVTLPGFSPPSSAHSVPSNPSRALTFNVNGTTRSSVNVRIDGASATNIWLPHISSYVPALESIETVNVVTSSFNAEQGLAGGAQVSVQLRSGTNEVHGAGFEYHSDNKLKAKNFFLPAGQRNPKLVYNQFGGRVGGAIIKNKLFYFTSYEGTTNRQFASRFATVPTAAMRAGDLSGSDRPIYDPATGTADGKNRQPFANNQIPASRIDPISAKLLSELPLPNQPGSNLANNFFGGAGYLFDRHTLDTKVNYNISEKLTTYARASWLKFDTQNAEIFGPQIGGAGVTGSSNSGHGFGSTWSTTLAATYIARPSFIVDAYFGYTLMDANSEQPRLDKNYGRDILGIPGTNGTRRFEGGLPTFEISSFSAFGSVDGFMPYYRHDPQFQYVANANWTKGSHNIRFGIDFANMNLNHTQPEFTGSNYGAAGGFGFTGGLTQLNGGKSGNEFNSVGSFLLGLPNRYGRILQVPDGYTTRTAMYSGYLRDQWQVNTKLTLSYGVRYEFYPFPSRTDRGMERYDFNNNKMLICGIGNVPKDCGTSVSHLNFAPRLGFAYRPSNNWVVRAGYGLNWDPWNIARTLRTNYPVLLVLNGNAPNSFVTPGRTFSEGIPQIVAPDLGNGIIDIPSAYALTSTGDKFQRSYIQSWNFTVQKQLAQNLSAQVGYVGTRQVHQTGNLDLNAGQIPGAGQAGRPYFAKFGRTSQTALLTPTGYSSYNSLQATMERRFSKGASLQASYTWSKSMGICCNDNSDGGPAIQALPFYSLNRSVTSFDRTHNLQLTGIFELPFGKGRRMLTSGLASAIAGGWQLNTVSGYYSGSPFSVSSDGASLNLPGSSQRADQVKGQVRKIGGIGRGQAYYDWTAFAPVTDARFGTAGFNTLRGPASFNSDLGLFRQFQISERVNLQFRAEAFNFTNTPKFNNPSGNISNLRLNKDGSFQSGVFEITSTAGTGREGIDERLMRLGLRFSF
jgi:hypothetical protein